MLVKQFVEDRNDESVKTLLVLSEKPLMTGASPHKGPVTRQAFLCHDVIMLCGPRLCRDYPKLRYQFAGDYGPVDMNPVVQKIMKIHIALIFTWLLTTVYFKIKVSITMFRNILKIVISL